MTNNIRQRGKLALAQFKKYNGGLTREQWLFHEIRVAAKLQTQGLSDAEILTAVTENNLFQFPTERMINNLTGVCLKRLNALNNSELVRCIAESPVEIAKQINVYAMMRHNQIVWDFMTTIIGEKYRTQDLSFQKKDLNLFFMYLREQDSDVAAWTPGTEVKIKQVLAKMLLEAGFISSLKSGVLNPVYLYDELEQGIRENKDMDALPAFNCFR